MPMTTPPDTTSSTPPPPPPSIPTPLATSEDPDEVMRLAIATALFRSKLLSKRSQPPPPPPQTSRQRRSPAFCSLTPSRWKQKAKDRKQEVLNLKAGLKHLEDELRGDLYPKSASCKCYFFHDLRQSNPKLLNYGFDHRFSDVLRRRFLRQVRLHKRFTTTASNSCDQRACNDLYTEEEIEQLKLSAEFLVGLCEIPNPVEKPHFANLAHQAVDFILGSLKHILSRGKDVSESEGVISNLIVHLIKRMCTPLEDELYCDPETDPQVHVQHIIRQLASLVYVGQRILLLVCRRISEQAEMLLSLDPFDESFAHIHDSLFVMIQLIECLVSDYLINWPKNEDFDTRLFEEWVTSFLHARNVLRSMEKRSGIYALYMDRVTGELARQVGHVSPLHKLSQEILDNLFS